MSEEERLLIQFLEPKKRRKKNAPKMTPFVNAFKENHLPDVPEDRITRDQYNQIEPLQEQTFDAFAEAITARSQGKV